LPDETVWHFFDRANLSEFYFSPEIAASLLAIAKCANDMKAMGDYGESTPHGEDSAQADSRKAEKLRADLVKQCESADSTLRSLLRLTN
jgi:hypothetical protein